MHMPEQIPPTARDESFAGVSYHVRGELVPQLQIEVGEQQVMFEHHVLLWKDDAARDRAAQAPGRHQAQDRRARLLHHEDEGQGHDRLLARLAGADGAVAPRARGRSCTFASTSSWRPRTTSTTRSSGSRACATCSSAARASSSTSSAPSTATRSSGCTATATCSWPTSAPASSSTSRRAHGCTRIRPSSSRRSRSASRWACSAAAASSPGTASPAPEGSRCRRCSSHRSRASSRGVGSGGRVAGAAGAGALLGRMLE